MRSATNGVTGARSCATRTSTWWSVRYACALSADISPFQNHRRRRRTYQFDRSSCTKSSIAARARRSWYASSAPRTSRTVVCRRERIHASSPSAPLGAAASGASAGRSRFAYVTNSPSTFQSVRNRRVTSRAAPSPKRIGSAMGCAANR